MTLTELGYQYLERADILTKRIHALSHMAKKMNPNDTETILLRRRISAFYADVLELKKCAEKMIEYERSEKREKIVIQP